MVGGKLPALGLLLLQLIATVVGYNGEAPEGGVVLGTVAGASLAAIEGDVHDDRYYTMEETTAPLEGKTATRDHSDLVP